MVYSLCGGINPNRTLPIFLDVGTNNPALLADPMYLGLRQPRIDREAYDHFIHCVMERLQAHFPHAFIHWEDFGRDNARRMLDYYQDQCCTFNDDIQGTGAVTLAALLAACHKSNQPLPTQRIVIFGAGSAGTGIADQILDAMIKQGLCAEDAYRQFWLVD
jgi:malate dehydrogenase (oxaloacetate-decarboxylating)